MFMHMNMASSLASCPFCTSHTVFNILITFVRMSMISCETRLYIRTFTHTNMHTYKHTNTVSTHTNTHTCCTSTICLYAHEHGVITCIVSVLCESRGTSQEFSRQTQEQWLNRGRSALWHHKHMLVAMKPLCGAVTRPWSWLLVDMSSYSCENMRSLFSRSHGVVYISFLGPLERQ